MFAHFMPFNIPYDTFGLSRDTVVEINYRGWNSVYFDGNTIFCVVSLFYHGYGYNYINLIELMTNDTHPEKLFII